MSSFTAGSRDGGGEGCRAAPSNDDITLDILVGQDGQNGETKEQEEAGHEVGKERDGGRPTGQ